MPSPFPGMDPYIEVSWLWPDFHHDLIAEMRARINQVLPPGYVARTDVTVTYEVVEISEPDKTRSIRPDVTLLQERDPQSTAAGVATLIPAAPFEGMVPLEAPIRRGRVEVRRVEDDFLVTVIELLSPVNKRSGHDGREEYLRKRRDVLRSSAHFMEIDLLRGGERSPLGDPPPAAPYYVMLYRENRRSRVSVWPIQLRDPLPLLPVPLRSPDADVPLDLGALVASAYERGLYDRQLDYRAPVPPPPLSPEDQAWVDELLRGRRGDDR